MSFLSIRSRFDSISSLDGSRGRLGGTDLLYRSEDHFVTSTSINVSRRSKVDLPLAEKLEDCEEELFYRSEDHFLSSTAISRSVLYEQQQDIVNATDDEIIPVPEPDKAWIIYRRVKTTCMGLAWFAMGFYVVLSAACIIDLKAIFETNYQALATAMGCRSVGMMIGSFLGGFLGHKYGHRGDLWIALALFVTGSCLAVIPFSTNVIVAAVLYAIIGIANNVLLGVGVPVMVSLWGKNVGSPLLGITSLSAVGQLVAPMVASPFLSEESNNITDLGDERFHFDYLVADHTLVYVPFAIAGALNVLPGIFFMGFCIKGADANAMSSIGNATHLPLRQYFRQEKSNGRLCAVVSFLFFLFITMFAGIGRLTCISQYIVAIAVESKLFSKSEAVILLTTYNVSGTISSFFFTFLLKVLSDKWVVFGPVLISTACLVAFYLQGFNSVILFWVLACVTGFLFKPFRGAIVGWINTFIDVTPFVMTINNFGVGAGGFIAHWLSGFLMETYGPHAVVLACLIFSGVVCVLIILMQLIIVATGNPSDKK